MCGRHALCGPPKRARADEAYFSHVDDFPSSWNVAPTHAMPIARLRERDDAARLEADDPKELMRPARNERLFACPAGPAVGKVANNHPSLIEPLEDTDRAHLALKPR